MNTGPIGATHARIVGGTVRFVCTQPLIYPVRFGHAWREACSGFDVYDSTGQVALPSTPEMLVSA